MNRVCRLAPRTVGVSFTSLILAVVGCEPSFAPPTDIPECAAAHPPTSAFACLIPSDGLLLEVAEDNTHHVEFTGEVVDVRVGALPEECLSTEARHEEVGSPFRADERAFHEVVIDDGTRQWRIEISLREQPLAFVVGTQVDVQFRSFESFGNRYAELEVREGTRVAAYLAQGSRLESTAFFPELTFEIGDRSCWRGDRLAGELLGAYIEHGLRASSGVETTEILPSGAGTLEGFEIINDTLLERDKSGSNCRDCSDTQFVIAAREEPAS